MNIPERSFTPFNKIVVPIVPDVTPRAAIALAAALDAEIELVGIVCLDQDTPLSAGAGPARALRSQLESLRASLQANTSTRVRVSHQPWDDLLSFLARDEPDLLVLEWPTHFKCLGITPGEAMRHPVSNVALVRGPEPVSTRRIAVPVRGGPYAELAVRLAMALPHEELSAIHIYNPEVPPSSETPFLGLSRVLPALSGTRYILEAANQPVQTILNYSARNDLIIMGATGRPPSEETGMGPVVSEIFDRAEGGVIVVKNSRPLPDNWSGSEGVLAGYGAISLLVDKWFAENTYQSSEFDNLEQLVDLKKQQGLTISLALPALNEEETVGEVIETIQQALVRGHSLLDEIVLIDSNSTDHTRQIAADMGIPVYIHQEILPQLGPRSGKGEALWKSLLVTHGDIVVWIDTDIVNIHPRFVYGVVGPLLANPSLQFVKGYYQRPLRSGEKTLATGGGRVTELTARPMLNLFYPELSGVIQPLSGEYGGRRGALEQLSFFSGYGVESGLLIDVFEKFGLSAIAQVDLQERVHHNQSLQALSKMSFTILQAFVRKIEKRYGVSFLEDINRSMKLIQYEEGEYFLKVEEVAELERPPMLEVGEYRERTRPQARPPVNHK